MDIDLRAARPDDHAWIVSVVNDWWGRPVAGAIPRLFLDHFHPTSLIAEAGGTPVGFLVGFLSPAEPETAYIHFVGVDPDQRGRDLGRRLYETFFEIARADNRSVVKAITAPVNTASIAFHERMGFAVSEPVEGYNTPGVAHVTFHRSL